jgi:uncharacterized protein
LFSGMDMDAMPALIPDLTLSAYLWLMFAALLAGYIDSIAGGGGMITVPALLAAGLPPQLALATNKLQASFGSGIATWRYWRGGLVELRPMLGGVVATALGAACGVLLVQWLSDAWLRLLIPAILVLVLGYLMFGPTADHVDRKARLPRPLFEYSAGLVIGCYDGFLGPGTGSFWTVGYVYCMGYQLKRAVAHAKVMNFTSNLVSLLVFALAGPVLWTLGLLMAVGQLVGGSLGAGTLLRCNPRFVRVLLCCVVLATLGKLLWDR